MKMSTKNNEKDMPVNNPKDENEKEKVIMRELIDDEINTDNVPEEKEDPYPIKLEPTTYDAYTDGTNIHRTYQFRSKSKPEPIECNVTVEIKEEKEEQSYRCVPCRKTFQSKTGLLNHTRMHQTVKQYTCALCQTIFPTNAELIQHKIVHNDEEHIFLCKICNMAFTDHCDFLVHETTHKKRSMYKCSECGSYQTPQYIKRHITTHFDNRLQCDHCDKTFQTSSGLNQHVLYDHKKEGKLIECVECGKMLKNKKEYECHMANHTGVKKYQCLYCGKGFIRPLARMVHTRTHTNERPFKCDICDRTFKQSTDMNRHKLSHGKKEIQCNMCDKKYKHKESLRIHMRVHRQTDLLYCPVCNKGCQNKQCLRTHMQYVHTTERAFECKLCNLMFKTKRDIIRHKESKTHKRAEYGAQRADREGV